MIRAPAQLTAWTAAALFLAGSGVAADFLLDDFEAEPERWGAGCVLDRERVKQGAASMRWQADRSVHISRSDIPHDWTEYRALHFWLFSGQATGNKLVITFSSENPDTDGGDYFVVYGTVDWAGWREFTLVLDRLAPARSPVGWHQVEAIHFHTRGWGQESPVAGTVLYLDDMRLLSRTPEELAAIHEQRERVRTGYATSLNDFEDLLSYFPRGGDGPDGWQLVGTGSETDQPSSLTQEWHGVRLRAGPRGVAVFARDFDIEVSAYAQIVVRAGVSAGSTLRATITVDGDRSSVEAAPGRGDLILPLTGKRLERLELELGGAGAQRSASVRCIVLRKPECPRPRPFSNLDRTVMVTWDRPSWGAAAYRLYRSSEPISAGNLPRATVAVPSVPAAVSAACDSPPAPGIWHYAVAPASDGVPMSPGLSANVDVAAGPSRAVVRVATPIEIDGDLEGWPENAPRIRFAGAAHVFSGQTPDSPADVGAEITLCHDGESLYLGARVTDDVVRHTSTRSWEGDGVVLMLLFSPPLPDEAKQRYALVLNYAAATSEPGGKPSATILEDRSTTYGADAKPSAPGRWAVLRHEQGYTVEAVVPIALLSGYGFDARAGGLGVGLSVYDCDSTEGSTRRETAITWQQKRGLYDPRDAVVLRWE